MFTQRGGSSKLTLVVTFWVFVRKQDTPLLHSSTWEEQMTAHPDPPVGVCSAKQLMTVTHTSQVCKILWAYQTELTFGLPAIHAFFK